MEKPADKRPQILQPSGGYEKLVSFQVAKLLYAVTVRFVDRYIPAGSRTADQMEQAARSGERNIGEGSKISATTKKLELNLTSVARASIDELRKDYEAYLEHRKLPLWAPMDPRRKELSNARCKDADEVARWILMVWEREKVQRMKAVEGPRTARTPRTVKDRVRSPCTYWTSRWTARLGRSKRKAASASGCTRCGRRYERRTRIENVGRAPRKSLGSRSSFQVLAALVPQAAVGFPLRSLTQASVHSLHLIIHP
jgi:hypothetical protein